MARQVLLLLAALAACSALEMRKPALGFNTCAYQCSQALPASRSQAATGNARLLPPRCRSWNAFYRDINETLVQQQADLMVSLGLRDVG